MELTTDIAKLQRIAKEIRYGIVKTVGEAGAGHIGGAMGMADIFTALYFSILKHNPKKPEWSERDRLLLSNGHICPVLYTSLAKTNYFDPILLKKFCTISSPLQCHPHLKSIPGVENTSGSLGQGLSQACGLALSYKMDNKDNRVFCITSDAEHQEGQIWEAYMFALKYKLNNLVNIIDRNSIQISGTMNNVMPLNRLKDKLVSFAWYVFEIDGHNFSEILAALNKAKQVKDRPSVIIAHTIAGKGVSFMENNYKWHKKNLSKKQLKQALAELMPETK